MLFGDGTAVAVEHVEQILPHQSIGPYQPQHALHALGVVDQDVLWLLHAISKMTRGLACMPCTEACMASSKIIRAHAAVQCWCRQSRYS